MGQGVEEKGKKRTIPFSNSVFTSLSLISQLKIANEVHRWLFPSLFLIATGSEKQSQSATNGSVARRKGLPHCRGWSFTIHVGSMIKWRGSFVRSSAHNSMQLLAVYALPDGLLPAAACVGKHQQPNSGLTPAQLGLIEMFFCLHYCHCLVVLAQCPCLLDQGSFFLYATHISPCI